MKIRVMLCLFLATTLANATTLDDLRSLHNEVTQRYHKNARMGTGLAFACAGVTAACFITAGIPMLSVMLNDWEPFVSCNHFVQSADDCLSARASIYRAKHFLKRIEQIYAGMQEHEEKEALDFFRIIRDNDIRSSLEAMQRNGITFEELINLIHMHNQQGLSEFLAQYPVKVMHYGDSIYYVAPNYLELMQRYFVGLQMPKHG